MSIPMFRPIAAPVTRYAGSKARLTSFIRKNLPTHWADYYEPFCGGLSVYCAMVNQYWAGKSYWISDLNADLIRVYQYIKTHPREMFSILWGYHKTHSPSQWYELSYLPKDEETELELAARYWYLMRHSYTNKMGKNEKTNKWIAHGAMTASYYAPSLQKTMALHEALNETDTTITNCEYKEIEKHVRAGDFVYLDPPYLSAHKGIYQNMLDEKEHIELAKWAWEMANAGAYVMISNYDSQETREIYKGMSFNTQMLHNTMRNVGGTRYNRELLAMTY